MDEIEEIIAQYRKRHGWDQTDTIPGLIKSVSIEAGELLETIQWDEENYDLQEIKGELADVLIYTLSLYHDLSLDVKDTLLEKIDEVNKR